MGLKRYFTGKPCFSGHVCERHVANGACVMCQKLRRRDTPKRPAKARKQKPEDKEKRAAWHREYRKSEAYRAWASGRGKEVRARYYRQNKAKMQAAMEAWKDENRERYRRKATEWARANRDRIREVRHNRRAAGRVPKGQVRKLLVLQEWRCVYCAADLAQTRYHVDHIVPIALGGTNAADNLQILCFKCNGRKGAKHPDDFLIQILG